MKNEQLELSFSKKKKAKQIKNKRCSFLNASDNTSLNGRQYIFIRGDYGFFQTTTKRSKKKYQIENLKKGVVLGHTGSRQKAKKITIRCYETLDSFNTKQARMTKAKNLFRYYGGIYHEQ